MAGSATKDVTTKEAVPHQQQELRDLQAWLSSQKLTLKSYQVSVEKLKFSRKRAATLTLG